MRNHGFESRQPADEVWARAAGGWLYATFGRGAGVGRAGRQEPRHSRPRRRGRVV